MLFLNHQQIHDMNELICLLCLTHTFHLLSEQCILHRKMYIFKTYRISVKKQEEK